MKSLLKLRYFGDSPERLEILSYTPNILNYPVHISINNQRSYSSYILTPEEIGKIIVTLAKVLAEHHVG